MSKTSTQRTDDQPVEVVKALFQFVLILAVVKIVRLAELVYRVISR